MKRIQIRIALLLLYVGVLGYFFYPKGLSPLEGEGLRWTLTFAGVLILLIALYLILRYREKKRSKYEYGQYPEKGEGQEGK
jgi:hypothetical protein